MSVVISLKVLSKYTNFKKENNPSVLVLVTSLHLGNELLCVYRIDVMLVVPKDNTSS